MNVRENEGSERCLASRSLPEEGRYAQRAEVSREQRRDRTRFPPWWTSVWLFSRVQKLTLYVQTVFGSEAWAPADSAPDASWASGRCRDVGLSFPKRAFFTAARFSVQVKFMEACSLLVSAEPVCSQGFMQCKD